MKKRTAVQNKRLKKLIVFLEKLPPKKFNFATVIEGVKSNGHQCATVGCAIGWLPDVFRNIRWGYNKKEKSWNEWFMINGKKRLFREVAEKFLGCPEDLFIPGTQRWCGRDPYVSDNRIPFCSAAATPKQVAKMLKVYMKLIP